MALLLLSFLTLAGLSNPVPRPCADVYHLDLWGHVTACEATGRASTPPSGSVDPDLEPGFPVSAFHGPGTYHSGPPIHSLVGNMDSDPQLEILRTGLARGPLHAWNHDGSQVTGWPSSLAIGAAYPALGELGGGTAHGEVVAGYTGLPGPGLIVAWDAGGGPLPGWPRQSSNWVATPPALADIDGDGVDEIFLGEETSFLHGYRADGTVLPGWPVFSPNAGPRHTPAIADLDENGDLEIVTATEPSGAALVAYHHTGAMVAGFPVIIPQPFSDTFPAIGDVDADGAPEIVVVTADPVNAMNAAARVFSASGVLERTIGSTGGLTAASVPALADLTGDGVPDIVVQTDGGLFAWKGDGTLIAGWPRTWTGLKGDSSPVIGDLTGDGLPEIAVVTQFDGVSGDVRVFDRAGNLHPRFPKVLPIGRGAVPAIADIDRDGRNELIVTGNYWDGVTGSYPIAWAYDLGGAHHGAVPWGQFMGNSRHTGTVSDELFPTGLFVDFAATGSDGNGVIEPGETPLVAPAWTNTAVPITQLTGLASSFTGPAAAGVSYSIVDAAAVYGPVPTGAVAICSATGDCYGAGLAWTGTRPVSHWDATFAETLSLGHSKSWVLHVGDSFADVARASPFYRFVETVFHHQVTSGCAANAYCPSGGTLRAQMAVFGLRSRFGSAYVPPPCIAGAEIFNDVPATSPFCRWVEDLARRSVVSGCGGGAFCPEAAILRQEMPVFVLRVAEGDIYVPPACVAGSERFADVPASSPFCPWIEEFARRGISGGCSPTAYCPFGYVTREQMAVFLSAAFRLRLYGP